MFPADTPAWQKSLLEIANEKGIEAARRHFTQGLNPLSRQRRQIDRIFSQFEQHTNTGEWSFKP